MKVLKRIVALFLLEEGDFRLVDAVKAERVGGRTLIPKEPVKAGRLYGRASRPAHEDGRVDAGSVERGLR